MLVKFWILQGPLYDVSDYSSWNFKHIHRQAPRDGCGYHLSSKWAHTILASINEQTKFDNERTNLGRSFSIHQYDIERNPT